MIRAHRTRFSAMYSVEEVEGETIENKCARIVQNNEPISDGAPPIYTEKKDGVVPAYDIRTDRWDVALTAMDKVQGARIAKSKEYMKKDEPGEPKPGEPKPGEPKPGATES